MHIDKKLMHRIFTLIAGAIVFAWLVLDTARATALFTGIWDLFSPFVAGAAIAFVFNVPLRAIENQLDGIHKTSIRRGLAIVLTVLCLVLIVMFVFELLIPQIRLTLASLSEKIPAFIDRTAQKMMILVEENPDLGIWIQETFNLESLNWSNILKDILAWLANQIFPILPDAVLGELAKTFVFTEMERVDDTHRAVRFCTSWATTEENVDKLCEALRTLAKL